MSETHRRPRAVPHISDPPGIKGEVSGMFQQFVENLRPVDGFLKEGVNE